MLITNAQCIEGTIILSLKNWIPLILVIVVIVEWSQTHHFDDKNGFNDKNETLINMHFFANLALYVGIKISEFHLLSLVNFTP